MTSEQKTLERLRELEHFHFLVSNFTIFWFIFAIQCIRVGTSCVKGPQQQYSGFSVYIRIVKLEMNQRNISKFLLRFLMM